MLKTCVNITLLGLLLLSSAQASLITVSASGTYGSNAPTNQLAAPDASWSLSVVLDAQPAGAVYGTAFELTRFYNFNYTLNGKPVQVTPALVEFGAAAYSYFDLLFSIGRIDFTTASSFFTGVTISPYDCGCNSPTLVPGNYQLLPFGSEFEGADNQGNQVVINSGATSLNLAAVPEPSSLPLTACTLGIFGLAYRFRRLALMIRSGCFFPAFMRLMRRFSQFLLSYFSHLAALFSDAIGHFASFVCHAMVVLLPLLRRFPWTATSYR